MRPRTQVVLIALLFFAVTAPVVALAQTANEATLPPNAKAAIEKGLSAAKQSGWNDAVRYFNEARQAAPESPVPLVNLGLAEAQLSGHELRAICWFEAYLALVPTAVNAPAVRQQISDLEIRAKSNANKIIEMLKVLAGQMPSSGDYWAAIAGLIASGGDLDAAEQTIPNQSDKNHARREIVEALAKLKRISDAIKEADQITQDTDKGTAYESIAVAQITAGLFSDAKKSITFEYVPFFHRLALAEAEYQAGKRDDAIALLSEVRAAIDKESSLDSRENRLADLAATEYKIGHHEEADALFKQVKKYAYGTTGRDKDSHRMWTLICLAENENKIGRRSVALGLMKEAETACRAARKAHEEPVGIQENEVQLWNSNLYKLNNWDGAEALGRRLEYRHRDAEHRQGSWDEIEIADHKRWFIAASSITSTEAASVKTLTDATSSPAQRAQAWSDYINGCLSAPLFTTDFKVTVVGLASFTPKADSNVKAQTIFDYVKQPAEDLFDRLNDIHELEAKQIKFVDK